MGRKKSRCRVLKRDMLAQGKSLVEIETFCQAFMTELSKHIGASPGIS